MLVPLLITFVKKTHHNMKVQEARKARAAAFAQLEEQVITPEKLDRIQPGMPMAEVAGIMKSKPNYGQILGIGLHDVPGQTLMLEGDLVQAFRNSVGTAAPSGEDLQLTVPHGSGATFEVYVEFMWDDGDNKAYMVFEGTGACYNTPDGETMLLVPWTEWKVFSDSRDDVPESIAAAIRR